MSSQPDVAIVGGGIAGLTIALAAAGRGLSSVIIDQPAPGAASRAAAGMLAPSLEGLPSHVLSHALAARDLYPDFLGELEDLTGASVELNRLGIVELADGEDELTTLEQRALPGAETLAPSELRSLEPALAPHAGALLHPHDGSVDNVQLMHALELAVSATLRIARASDQAVRINVADTPTVETRGGALISAAWIVLAGGSWTNELAGLPTPIPVRPVRGQLLTLKESPIRHVMYAPGSGYLVPRSGELVVGATTEHTGFVSETTGLGRQELFAVVSRTLPTLEHGSVLSHWAGLRPMTPDTLPILGADPAAPRVVHAAGFSRNGILLAPWAAGQLAELLATERTPASLDSFSIRRFADAD